MSTVAVVGAGEVGGAVAQALAAGGHVSRVVLIDQAETVAAGKALDILQAGAIIGAHARLEGTGDIAAVVGCAACILADQAMSGHEWQGDEGFSLLTRLLQHAGEAPIILAGAAQDELLVRAVTELRVARRRVLGSAPEALASAVRAVVAAEAPCSPAEVGISVLGVPGGFVVLWDQATIAGLTLVRVLSQSRLAHLETRVARLWPPGPHVLGIAAARMAEAVLGTSRRTFHAFALLQGELGVRSRISAVPVRLYPDGIADVVAPALSTRDRVRLQTVLGE